MPQEAGGRQASSRRHPAPARAVDRSKALAARLGNSLPQGYAKWSLNILAIRDPAA